MHERTIRMSCVVAASLWVTAVVLTALGTVALLVGRDGVALATFAHAMIVTAAATAATVKVSIERATRTVLGRMEITDEIGPLRRAR